MDEIDESLKCTQNAFPAKELAVEHFDNPLFANTIVLGAMAKTVELLEKDAVLESILHIIPKFHERNRKAFEIGYDYMNEPVHGPGALKKSRIRQVLKICIIL